MSCMGIRRSLTSFAYRSKHSKPFPSLVPTRPAFQPHTTYLISFVRTYADSPGPVVVERPDEDEKFRKDFQQLVDLVYGLTEAHPEARASLDALGQLGVKRIDSVAPHFEKLGARGVAITLMRDPTLQAAGTKAIVAFRDAGIGYDLTRIRGRVKAWGGGITDEDIAGPDWGELQTGREGDGKKDGDGKGVGSKV